MKVIKSFSFIVAGFLSATMAVQALEMPAKIAVVDLAYAYEQFEKRAQVEKDLQKEENQFRSDSKERQKEFQALVDKMQEFQKQLGDEALSADEKKKIREKAGNLALEIKTERGNLIEYEKRNLKLFTDRQARVSRKLMGEVRDALTKISKDKYHLVVNKTDKTSFSILYTQELPDLTQDLIKELNKKK